MSEIFLTDVQRMPTFICMQTSKRTCIDNTQNRDLIVRTDIASFQAIKHSFGLNAKWLRTSPTRMYNCHGLTFASRRTGIDKPEALRAILQDDYLPVKKAELQEGDIVVYLDNSDSLNFEDNITHTAMVVYANHQAENLSEIRVLSKLGIYIEVVHDYESIPLMYGTIKKFYRMNYEGFVIE